MFLAAKLLAAVTRPEFVLLCIATLGMVLLFTRKWRWGRGLLAGLGGLLAVLGTLPLETWLLVPLEERFPPPQSPPQQVDGIIVLGGAVSVQVAQSRGQPSVNAAAERLTVLPELARRYPQARIVFTGGSGDPLAPERKEAPVARDFLAGLGMDVDRIVFEDQSRNTYENAVLTRELVRPQPGERWLLVTSAMHMPRSVGVFRAAGWPVIPYPVDYQTTGAQSWSWRFDPLGALNTLSRASYEWQGLLYYRLRGWSDSLYPDPGEGL